MMKILGIESSCDETAFAVVESNGRVLSNVIASQIDIHARYGGVVPEIASRAHLEAIPSLFEKALAEANVSINEIDAIAATQGPGLSGCLLVGFEFGKGLALRYQKPFIPVHHIVGHLESVFLGTEENAWHCDLSNSTKIPERFEPYLALVISGGHSSIISVPNQHKYKILGQTMDDAVGEAYDKIAKLLGLPYPGGPVLDKRAQVGNPEAFDFPLPLTNNSEYKNSCMFSFSGLKTAVAREVEAERRKNKSEELSESFINDVAASFQKTAVASLIQRIENALEIFPTNRLALAGGVACNSEVRKKFLSHFSNIKIAIPKPEYCTDNAAMIAGVGATIFEAYNESNSFRDLQLNVKPSWSVEDFPNLS